MHEIDYEEDIDYKTPSHKLNKKILKDPFKLKEVINDVEKANEEFRKTLKNSNSLFETYK